MLLLDDKSADLSLDDQVSRLDKYDLKAYQFNQYFPEPKAMKKTHQELYQDKKEELKVSKRRKASLKD